MRASNTQRPSRRKDNPTFLFRHDVKKKILFSSHCGVQCNILGSNLAQDLWNTICSEFPLFLKEIIPSKTSQAWQKTAVTKAFITNVCLHFGPCSDLICKLPVHPVTYHFLWVCKHRCKCVNECECVYYVYISLWGPKHLWGPTALMGTFFETQNVVLVLGLQLGYG